MDAANVSNWIANLSATALQGAILWYLVTKAIPSIVAEFRAEMTAQRQHCDEKFERADRWVKDLIAEIKGKTNA